jgi:hypothetical protein
MDAALLTPMTPSEQEIVAKAIDGFIFAAIGFIFHQVRKVVQNVSMIPKIQKDLTEAFKRIRSLENGRYSKGSDSDESGEPDQGL